MNEADIIAAITSLPALTMKSPDWENLTAIGNSHAALSIAVSNFSAVLQLAAETNPYLKPIQMRNPESEQITKRLYQIIRDANNEARFR